MLANNSQHTEDFPLINHKTFIKLFTKISFIIQKILIFCNVETLKDRNVSREHIQIPFQSRQRIRPRNFLS